jgi:hypothetical protein
MVREQEKKKKGPKSKQKTMLENIECAMGRLEENMKLRT